MNEKKHIVGIISDTHGILSEGVVEAFKDVDLIIHAGDMDRLEIFERLKTIAPVVPARGNMDSGRWADDIPAYELTELGGICFYVIHDLFQMDLDPEAAGINVVVSGHTHIPSIKWKDGILFVNPGSAGYPKYDAEASVAKVELNQGKIIPEIVEV